MNKLKLIPILFLALALSAMQFDRKVFDKPGPPVTPITFTYQRLTLLDPGKVWVDGSGLHIRNRVETGKVSGGINGFARFVYNADLNFNGIPSEDAILLHESVSGKA